MSPALEMVTTTDMAPPGIIRTFLTEEPAERPLTSASIGRDIGLAASTQCRIQKFIRFHPTAIETVNADAHHQNIFKAPTAGKTWEKVLTELGSLVNVGDFVAPSKQVLRDLESITRVLPNGACFPEVEHDDSTGMVSLRWYSEETEAMFSLTITGNGQVVATLIHPMRAMSASWRFRASDEFKMLTILDDIRVSKVILFDA